MDAEHRLTDVCAEADRIAAMSDGGLGQRTLSLGMFADSASLFATGLQHMKMHGEILQEALRPAGMSWGGT